MSGGLDRLQDELIACRRCSRLVAWREHVAAQRRAAYATETYWGKPVPAFGDPAARLVIVGLAPGAHGANRTGRMFTGDGAGTWLVAALHRTGFANQATSVERGDGLELGDVWITSAVRCAPPDNRPTPAERDACASWLDAELAMLPNTAVVLCLGQFAYHSVWRSLRRRGHDLPVPRPRFAHGLMVELETVVVSASYHPSRQNTATGKLTEQMLDQVLVAIREALHAAPGDQHAP